MFIEIINSDGTTMYVNDFLIESIREVNGRTKIQMSSGENYHSNENLDSFVSKFGKGSSGKMGWQPSPSG